MTKARAADRLGMDVWLDAGLAILAEEGFAALTVDRLSASVGRSKGSFYHHFQGTNGFVDALLGHWRALQTEAVVQRVEMHSDPAVRREELRQQAIGLDHDVERAVRVWAGSDPRARAVIKAVDDRRVSYLSKIIKDVSPRSNEEAVIAARLEYAAFIGLHQLYPDAGPELLGPLFARLSDLITPPECESGKAAVPPTEEEQVS